MRKPITTRARVLALRKIAPWLNATEITRILARDPKTKVSRQRVIQLLQSEGLDTCPPAEKFLTEKGSVAHGSK